MFDHLKNFTTGEGHWTDFDILKPVVLEMFNKHKVKSILEIGFNIGYSASLFLESDPDNKCKYTSVDIGRWEDTKKAADAVKSLYPDRFSFILKDSKYVYPDLEDQVFDLIFIDGDHSPLGVQRDIALALKLKIPLLLFDDWHPADSLQGQYSNGVKVGCDSYAKQNKIKLLEVYDLKREQDKIALYKNDSIHPTENILKRQLQFLSP